MHVFVDGACVMGVLHGWVMRGIAAHVSWCG